MTRTARAAFPRAIVKDRQSRTGLNNDMKKDGAGKANWGKDIDVDEPEYDEYNSEEELSSGASQPQPTPRKRSSSVPNEKEIEAAKQLRKNALHDGVDLATIARTSVAVSSPAQTTIPVVTDADTAV